MAHVNTSAVLPISILIALVLLYNFEGRLKITSLSVFFFFFFDTGKIKEDPSDLKISPVLSFKNS